MRNLTEKEFADFHNLLVLAETQGEIKNLNFKKWFTVEAVDTYNSDLIIGGRNCGESIFVDDKFNSAFKLQNMYNPTVNGEKSKSIVYQTHQVSVQIKAIECYGQWINEVTSGYTFQAVFDSNELEFLNLPPNHKGKKWRLGNNWIFPEPLNYIIANTEHKLNDYDIIQF